MVLVVEPEADVVEELEEGGALVGGGPGDGGDVAPGSEDGVAGGVGDIGYARG